MTGSTAAQRDEVLSLNGSSASAQLGEEARPGEAVEDQRVGPSAEIEEDRIELECRSHGGDQGWRRGVVLLVALHRCHLGKPGMTKVGGAPRSCL